MSLMLAHGIGGIQNLPIPRWVFFAGAAGILTISFLGLFFLWPRPVLAEKSKGRPFAPGLERFLLSRGLRVAVGAVSFALFLFLWFVMMRKPRREGILTLTFGLWYGIARILEDSLRIDKRFFGLTGSQWTAVAVATASAVVLLWWARHPDPEAPSGGGPAPPEDRTATREAAGPAGSRRRTAIANS